MISACGVLCSNCPAFESGQKGVAHQKSVVEAWERIYGLKETPEHIFCGGCLSSDNEVFHTSVDCPARLCCQARGLNTCAECTKESCAKLARAQKVWDEVPNQKAKLSPDDFTKYALPYCDHRKRLQDLRNSRNLK